MLTDVRTRVRVRATWRRRHSASSAAAAELVALLSQSPSASSVSARRRCVVIATSRRSRGPSGSRCTCVNDHVSVTGAVVHVLLPRIVLRHLLHQIIVSIAALLLVLTASHRFAIVTVTRRVVRRPVGCVATRRTIHARRLVLRNPRHIIPGVLWRRYRCIIVRGSYFGLLLALVRMSSQSPTLRPAHFVVPPRHRSSAVRLCWCST